MSTLPTATARDLIAAILATLRDHFGALDIQIGAGQMIDVVTDEEVATLIAPWLMLHVIPQELDTVVRRQPGRVPILYACQIQCCLSTKTADFATELAEFASNVLTLVGSWPEPGQRVRLGELQIGQRWGLGAAVEQARRITCYPGALNSLPHGHDALIVSWEQTLYRPERLTADDPLL